MVTWAPHAFNFDLYDKCICTQTDDKNGKKIISEKKREGSRKFFLWNVRMHASSTVIMSHTSTVILVGLIFVLDLFTSSISVASHLLRIITIIIDGRSVLLMILENVLLYGIICTAPIVDGFFN